MVGCIGDTDGDGNFVTQPQEGEEGEKPYKGGKPNVDPEAVNEGSDENGDQNESETWENKFRLFDKGFRRNHRKDANNEGEGYKEEDRK